jgi:hypothetical protein
MPPPILHCIEPGIERGRADCRTTLRAMNACTMLEGKAHQLAVDVSHRNRKHGESTLPRPHAANLSGAGRSGVDRLRKALPRLVRPARTGFNPVRPAYCETFSGSGRRGTPGLLGADGDAEYRPPRCDGEADVGVVRTQPGRGLDHAAEGT